MKKILICLFIMMFITESVYCLNVDGFKDIVKAIGKDDISVIYQGKEVGRFSKEQFTTLIKSSDFYEKMTIAEKNNKVNVILKDNPWKVKLGDTFKSSMDIIWIAEDGTTLKTMTVDISLQTDKRGQAFLIYQDLCVFLFPGAVLVIILLILLLTIK
jgi:hypothetical protein